MSNHVADPDFVSWTEDRKTCIFKPRGLNIIWGRDQRYWIVPTYERAIAGAAAELKKVSWLEVRGSTQVVGGKKYQISFTVSLTADASGWEGAPLFLMAKVGSKGRDFWKKVRFFEDKNGGGPFVLPHDRSFVITVPHSSDNPILYFGLYEIWAQKWKTGLQIHEAVVEQLP